VQDEGESAEQVVAATKAWLEKAVIGLRLCPFAPEPVLNDRVRFYVSEERSPEGLLGELARELLTLQAIDPSQCETTLLIHPWVLNDFLDYNDFLQDCDDVVERLDLEGELQVASFHPHYQFAGTRVNDIENFTNRSPYPILHLLREASVERAVAGFEGIDEIGPRNIETLRTLGHEGWRRLWLT
jgi:uncharacterized protein